MPRSSAARRCRSPRAWPARLPAGRSPSVSSTIEHEEKTMAKPEDTLTLETTKGNVVIAMRPDLAPGHVARIKELVKEGFYDGIVFHRVIDCFMAQTSCPQATGPGGSGQQLKAQLSTEARARGTRSVHRPAC